MPPLEADNLGAFVFMVVCFLLAVIGPYLQHPHAQNRIREVITRVVRRRAQCRVL